MQCVTVSYGKVKGKARRYQYWQPALYTIHTKKNGEQVWKYEKHLGTARRSAALAEKDAENLAKKQGIYFLNQIRNFSKVKTDALS